MINRIKPILILLLLSSSVNEEIYAKEFKFSSHKLLSAQDTSSTDSLMFSDKLQMINRAILIGDSVDVQFNETKPHLSIQQALKGMVTGLMVGETTGEPGRDQNMFVRGISRPIIYKSDIFSQQPLVIMDGVPLIGDHPFVYDIKKYDDINIGPATNYLANSDMDNISSIELIKDPAQLVAYGPLATNGVILIKTKKVRVGSRQISINSFFGVTGKTAVTPVNGDYENRFRSQFYGRYADQEMKLNYAGYLRDSTNSDYYGPTNWHKSYFQESYLHNINLSISGGSNRANFRFYGGVNTTPGAAEETNLTRYNGVFYINMVPYSWLTLSSMVNVTRLDRDRNKSFRDRYNETGYLPDVTTPLPPGGNVYNSFLKEYDKVIDDNINNMTKGFVSLRFDLLPNLNYNTQFSFDYNQSIRDVFWPTTLMETINYVSNYFGFNQRFNLTNKLNYRWDVNERNSLAFDLGHIYWADKHRYNYGMAYDGPSDFIKVNVVQGNASESGYLAPTGFMTYRYTDGLSHKLSSFYGTANYKLDDLLDFTLTVRNDGSSYRRPDKRWYTSGGGAAKLNLLALTPMGEAVNRFVVGASYSRIGETFSNDQYAYGPQYRVDLGWDEQPAMISYNGFATVSRPYSMGWISYDINTPYTDKVEFNLGTTFFDEKLNLDVSLYSNTTSDMPLLVSVPQEYGYRGRMASGMRVNNRGVEGRLSIKPFSGKAFNWETNFLLSYNKNELKSLPGGLTDIVIGNRKFVVGESISKFWLYENQGIINETADIPTFNGDAVTFNGIDLQIGDPIWNDINNDGNITSDDKVLKGEMVAPFIGSWNNTFHYKKWRLDVNTIAHIGNKILNNATANYYDFINNEQSNSLNSIKEIFHWEQQHAIDEYPFYNPWSTVVPYRKDQDLFLEDGSFFKVKSATLGYEIVSPLSDRSDKRIKRLFLYGTASNLLTVSNFSGKDPEFSSIMGEYDGYGMAMPRMYFIGFKLDL